MLVTMMLLKMILISTNIIIIDQTKQKLVSYWIRIYD